MLLDRDREPSTRSVRTDPVSDHVKQTSMGGEKSMAARKKGGRKKATRKKGTAKKATRKKGTRRKASRKK